MGWTAHAPTRTAANEAWWNLFGPSFEARLMTRSLTRAQDDPISDRKAEPGTGERDHRRGRELIAASGTGWLGHCR